MDKNVNLKFQYRFEQETGILYKYYFGEITLQDIEYSWRYAIDSGRIPNDARGFVLDYRQATLNVCLDKLDEIPKFFFDNVQFFRGCRIAIVTETPDDIVIPMLVMEKDHGYVSRPFSTVLAASKWVLG